MSFDPEFKKALQLLPEKEKDKLILRLLRRDLQLSNRLYFELVDTDSVQDKRNAAKERIAKRVQIATKHYYSAGYLLVDLRDISGLINEHVYITKDKVGEIVLQCYMLRSILEQNTKRIATETAGKSHTFCIYVIARMFKILMLIQKQHEDFHLDFQEDVEAIGQLICDNRNLKTTAIQNGLDVNWLILFEIPQNITEIYKDLRQRGLLR